MWISRKLFEELVRQNAATAAQLAASMAEHARTKASADWLAQHVNRLEQERAALFGRILEVQLPVVRFEREETPATQPSAPSQDVPSVEALRKLAATLSDRTIAPPDKAPGTIFRADDPRNIAEAEQAVAAAIFEDPGDEIARERGAAWDAEGRLAYK